MSLFFFLKWSYKILAWERMGFKGPLPPLLLAELSFHVKTSHVNANQNLTKSEHPEQCWRASSRPLVPAPQLISGRSLNHHQQPGSTYHTPGLRPLYNLTHIQWLFQTLVLGSWQHLVMVSFFLSINTFNKEIRVLFLLQDANRVWWHGNFLAL